jgi:predicted RNA-binding protein with PUA-like domain
MKPLPSPVTLQEVKGEKSLEGISLIKQSRLSVMPITPKEYERILGMGGI